MATVLVEMAQHAIWVSLLGQKAPHFAPPLTDAAQSKGDCIYEIIYPTCTTSTSTTPRPPLPPPPLHPPSHHHHHHHITTISIIVTTSTSNVASTSRSRLEISSPTLIRDKNFAAPLRCSPDTCPGRQSISREQQEGDVKILSQIGAEHGN